MTEAVMPQVNDLFRAPLDAVDSSLMTLLALVEGDVLISLERDGTTTLRHLIRELEWPAPMVTMGIGALIRTGLLRATQRELEVILTPVSR